MEPLQCGVIAFFVFWTGFILGKIHDRLYCKMEIYEESRELRQAEAKIIGKKIDKELKKDKRG